MSRLVVTLGEKAARGVKIGDGVTTELERQPLEKAISQELYGSSFHLGSYRPGRHWLPAMGLGTAVTMAAGLSAPVAMAQDGSLQKAGPEHAPGMQKNNRATFQVTNNNDAGAGSLRQAVIDANAAPGADVITFDSSVTGTITLTGGEIDISDDVAIAGPGAATLTISGNMADRIFNIYGTGILDVEISGLTLTDGSPAGNGGAIWNRGDEFVNVISSTVTGNDATFGGGIYSSGGVLRVVDSTISYNYASSSGGGIAVDDDILVIQDSTISGNDASYRGGGLYTEDTESIAISGSTFDGNYAGGTGGGAHFYDPDGPIRISDTDFFNNSSNAGGGAIYLYNFDYEEDELRLDNVEIAYNYSGDYGGGVSLNENGNLSIFDSNIHNNYANNGGGGIFFVGDARGNRLRIEDSYVDNNYAFGGDGGGVFVYSEEAEVLIRNSSISYNYSEEEGGGFSFYGATSTGSIWISNSTINGNEAEDYGGGIFIAGDDFYGQILIEDSTIYNNAAGGKGGGIHLYFDDGLYADFALIRNSTISGNNAGYRGGGIWFYDDDGEAPLIIEGSTIASNYADGSGGGIFFYSDDGFLIVSNSTVSGNYSTYHGGGIANFYAEQEVRIANSTIVYNYSANYGGGIFNSSGQGVNIYGSIVSGNTAFNGYDLYGDYFYLLNSLISYDGGFNTGSYVATIFDVSADLGPLANNGGPTLTHLPNPGSPVIDAGVNAGPSARDQRGGAFDRFVGLQTDMGAVETSTITGFNPGPADLTVTNLNDSGAGSLRYAVYQANAMAGEQVIDFQAGLTGTISLNSDIDIYDDVIIDGPSLYDITLDGQGSNRHFYVGCDVQATFEGLTFAYGYEEYGGSIYICDPGFVTIHNSRFEDNTAYYSGGAIYLGGGLLRVVNTDFLDNRAEEIHGGAIAIDDGLLIVSDSGFYNNYAEDSGGAIYAQDSHAVAITNSTFGYNSAGTGGAIHLDEPNVSAAIGESYLYGNYSASQGGAVFVDYFESYGDSLILDDVVMARNRADENGGAVSLDEQGNMFINSSTFRYNYSGQYGGAVFFAGSEVANILRVTGSGFDRNYSYYGGGAIAIIDDGDTPEGGFIVQNSDFRYNEAQENGGAFLFYVDATDTSPMFVIEGSTFEGNRARLDGGAISFETDDFEAALRFEYLEVNYNYAGEDGGGIAFYADDGVYDPGVLMTELSVIGNTAGYRGGGLFLYDDDGEYNMVIKYSTIAGNSAGYGGGVWVYSDDGNIWISSSTISGNYANQVGGGFLPQYVEDYSRLLNSTIAFNTAGSTGGGIGSEDYPSEFRFWNSIVSNNTAPTGPDAYYTFLASRFSIIGDTTDANYSDDGGNQFNVDPMLAPLARGSGQQTHALLPGSPAINTGLNMGPSAYDQRGVGFPRTIAGCTDIGAFEASAGTPLVSLSIVGSPLAEAGGVATVTATLDTPACNAVVVDLGLTGDAEPTDFVASLNQIAIPKGMTTGSMTITGVDDMIEEPDETVIVDIVGVSGGAMEDGMQQVTAIIVDDESMPLVTIALVGGPTIPENGGTASIEASLDITSKFDVTVDLGFTGTATNGVDFAPSATSIVIPAGNMRGTFDIDVDSIDDMLDEPDETVIVDVVNVTNGVEDGVQQQTITIQDDDAPPLVTLAIAGFPVDEGFGTGTITANLSAASGFDVTVNLAFGGTATMPDDYMVSATSIVIPAGSTSGSIDVNANMDAFVEGDETVVVDIDTVVNGTEDGEQQVTGIIRDSGLLVIPTLSNWGLAILGALMPLGAMAWMRRRKQAVATRRLR